MIFIENKKKGKKTLDKLYPNAEIIDVTSKGSEPFFKLSPFYPHGNIPIPFSPSYTSQSVEGVWQGLKVFESDDVDISKFEIRDMKGIKRTVRKFGKPLGHRNGVSGDELLDYITARKKIYLPTYAWILQNKTVNEIELLTNIALKKDLVLLDFDTNDDIENAKKPLSHASLVKKYIDKKNPEIAEKRFTKPDEKAIVKTRAKKAPAKRASSKKIGKNNSGQTSLDF